jgi:hypothetical protein
MVKPRILKPKLHVPKTLTKWARFENIWNGLNCNFKSMILSLNWHLTNTVPNMFKIILKNLLHEVVKDFQLNISIKKRMKIEKLLVLKV